MTGLVQEALLNELANALLDEDLLVECIATENDSRCSAGLERPDQCYRDMFFLNLSPPTDILKTVIERFLCDRHRTTAYIRDIVHRCIDRTSDSDTAGATQGSAFRVPEESDSDEESVPELDQDRYRMHLAQEVADTAQEMNTGSPRRSSGRSFAAPTANRISARPNERPISRPKRLAQGAQANGSIRGRSPSDFTYNRQDSLKFGPDSGSSLPPPPPSQTPHQRSSSAPGAVRKTSPARRPRPPPRDAYTEPGHRTGRTPRQQLPPPRMTITPPSAPPNQEEQLPAVPGQYAEVDGNSASPDLRDLDEDVIMVDIRPSSPSPPGQEPKMRTVKEIDHGIKKAIKARLSMEDNHMGTLYIFRHADPQYSHILKIGMTKNESTDRRLGIEAKCKLKLDDRFSPLPFLGYKRAEKLVKAELANFRARDYPCQNASCGEHREWFKVSEELAMKTIVRWADFMRQTPYTEERHLKDVWLRKLHNMKNPDEGERIDAHQQRRKRWDFIDPPSELVRLRNIVSHWLWHPVWEAAFFFFWQLSCLLFLSILLVTYWNKVVLVPFLFYLCLALASILCHLSEIKAQRKA